MIIDPWILAFSAATVIATIWMGFWSAKRSKTTHDFFVAGRSVSVGWNASAISGEYLSAASFMGVAGMVMSSGYDALWYPVCYACGYLFLLLFIAGPLRRFGAYTIPDFAEGRFDSPLFRKIAVVFVLFIGFFYTMPQMKGAGTTLAYIFPGMPYWGGVVLVGAVITLNVALGGMKGITLVQAFQYWLKMFAISVPIFALMAVYGHYGSQLGMNTDRFPSNVQLSANTTIIAFVEKLKTANRFDAGITARRQRFSLSRLLDFKAIQSETALHGRKFAIERALGTEFREVSGLATGDPRQVFIALSFLGGLGEIVWVDPWTNFPVKFPSGGKKMSSGAIVVPRGEAVNSAIDAIEAVGGCLIPAGTNRYLVAKVSDRQQYEEAIRVLGWSTDFRKPLADKAPADATWLSPFGPLTTKAAKAAAAALTNNAAFMGKLPLRADLPPDTKMTMNMGETNVAKALLTYSELTGRTLLPRTNSLMERIDEFFGGRLSRWHVVKPATRPDTGVVYHRDGRFSVDEVKERLEALFRTHSIVVVPEREKYFRVVAAEVTRLTSNETDQSLLTSAATKAAKAWLAEHERPLALLYTYSLIIALVCGTAGLPHILVRFYTNPDGVAAKRTTMWVMILIGVFYLFPPVFGVMGRNLLPELYTGAGAKGTDKVVLELPRVLSRDDEQGSAGVAPDSISSSEVSARTPKPTGETPALPK